MHTDGSRYSKVKWLVPRDPKVANSGFAIWEGVCALNHYNKVCVRRDDREKWPGVSSQLLSYFRLRPGFPLCMKDSAQLHRGAVQLSHWVQRTCVWQNRLVECIMSTFSYTVLKLEKLLNALQIVEFRNTGKRVDLGKEHFSPFIVIWEIICYFYEELKAC